MKIASTNTWHKPSINNSSDHFVYFIKFYLEWINIMLQKEKIGNLHVNPE